ncbi:ATP-dependent zinc metalloprotease FtsH [Desulfohalovibrio reitneri]|uniref:ATP-dependent zinc metalloprotease FtsH n=1 Tax=Desulfohalovibrio reitneri TaxID=1307759 RepID=UPI0009DEDC85|nr:ATP-dependent zinc metalloprotease FtsH [Desulfohalovibrio reitneri]
MADFKGRKTPGQQAAGPGGFWRIVLIILAAWLAMNLLTGGRNEPLIDYTMFLNQVERGNVESVTLEGREVTGVFKEPVQIGDAPANGAKPAKNERFTTHVPDFGDDDLLSTLREQGVSVKTLPARDRGWFWYLVISFLPLLLIGGLIYMQYRRMQGGGGGGMFNIGKSKARRAEPEKQKTTFDDVAGAKGPKKELEEIINFLKDPSAVRKLGGEVPRGMLLVGPPGTGKTLLARAVAGEAGVPFYHISGSDFMEMFVGVGASRVRDLFKEAKKNAPSIVFIDELDSIGRRRGAGLGGGHDEREQTLNQLLSELDGFEPNEDVIVMSATNRPDILDPALLRPGRFDRRVSVPMPSVDEREEILDIYVRNKPLADDVDLRRLASSTPGFSGADLENILNEAALLAARAEREEIANKDIENARDKVMMGLQRHGLTMTEEEKRIVAFHEAGHAMTAALLPRADPLHKVSVIPRAQSMGVTQQFPERDRYIYRKEYMLDRLAVMMGGRASEMLVFGTATSGAGNDLQQAFKLARRMVLSWGMSEKFAHMAMGGPEGQVFLGEEIASRREYSDQTATEVDLEVKSLLDEAYQRARECIEDHREELDKIVEELLDQEEIPGKRVLDILGVEKQPPKEAERQDA